MIGSVVPVTYWTDLNACRVRRLCQKTQLGRLGVTGSVILVTCSMELSVSHVESLCQKTQDGRLIVAGNAITTTYGTVLHVLPVGRHIDNAGMMNK